MFVKFGDIIVFSSYLFFFNPKRTWFCALRFVWTRFTRTEAPDQFCVFWYSRVTSIQSPIIYVHIFTSCPICLLKCVISTENNIIIIVAFVFHPTDERLQAMSTENCRSSSHQEMDFLHFSDFYRSNYLYRTSEVSLSLHTKQKIK